MNLLGISILALLLLAFAPAAGDEGYLPTPYTAAEIREASRAAVETLSRTTTPEGVSHALDRISVVSDTRAAFSRQPLDDDLAPSGDPVRGEATWEELRRHALFPESSATRDRRTMKTALGSLEGWYYEVRGEDGTVSEFFFADRYPGPPVVYSQSRDGAPVFRVEQVEKRPHEAD